MPKFDCFVIFAEMRTGSNFLESNVNTIDGLMCHGEAFNPHFIGYPARDKILDVGQSERDVNPAILLDAIRTAPGLNGFRFFNDHDPRVLDTVLDDPKCAKVILIRNPADSYVSWKIAKATGQWKLTDAKTRKDSKGAFDAEEFFSHLEALQAFQLKLLNRLQMSGQTAFYLAYEDLQNVDVMNGLAKWLGVKGRLQALDLTLKVQNPAPLSEKVSNYGQMTQALSDLDPFNLMRTPNFEPRRGPIAPSYFVSRSAPLMYLPVRGGGQDRLATWIAELDEMSGTSPRSGMTQKDLRQWMRVTPGHRKFTVLRHPLARAHSVFCNRILNSETNGYPAIRATLSKRYDLPIPSDPADAAYDKVAHRAAFAAFLRFLKANLAGQTAIRVDPDWASQSSVIEGFAGFVTPDRLMREDTVEQELAELAATVALTNTPDLAPDQKDTPYPLADIYDAEIEKLCRSAYARDYLLFGFADWVPQ